jgi:hypothetical protein
MVGNNIDEAESQGQIKKLIQGLTKPGYVLVKHRGNVYLCERNDKNKERGYDRTLVAYHPLSEMFAP